MKALIVISTISVYIQVVHDGGSRSSMETKYKKGEFNDALTKSVLLCIEEEIQDFTIIDTRSSQGYLNV